MANPNDTPDESQNTSAQKTLGGFHFAVPYPNAPSSSAMAWSFSPTSHGATIAAAANGSHYPGNQHRDSFVHRQELESMFYQDLVCCNRQIQDLHELLRHYEDYHHNNQPLPQPQPMDQDELPAALAFATNQNSVTTATATPTTAITLKQPDEEEEQDDSMMPIIPGVTDDSEELLASIGVGGFNPYQQGGMLQGDLKPYKCPIPGCQKSYKNPNGLKYHREHGHVASMEDDELVRPFRCILCNKGYRQMSGLKYHMTHGH